MEFKNTPSSYGAVTKTLHWVIGLTIICLLGVGLYMTQEGLDAGLRLKLYPLHKSFGILVLMLAAARVGWHLYSRPAGFVPEIKAWEKWLARAVHYLLYIAMFLMPLSGWIFSSAAGRTVKFFGLFDLPDLVEKNEETRNLFADIHEVAAYTLIAVICLHAAGALKHHFISKDATLRRMLPF